MKRRADSSWPKSLRKAVAALLVRKPDVLISIVAHAALLTVLYYFGNYQIQMRRQDAMVASSLRATSMASTAKRLQDLETIKQLLEKSANREDPRSAEQSLQPPIPAGTPEAMVERAREVFQAIEALDEDIRAEELAGLLGDDTPPPPLIDRPPAESPNTKTPERALRNELLTADSAASEVATLEARARETLARRQMRLEARANGVRVDGGNAHSPDGDARDRDVRVEIADFMSSGERNEQGTRLQPGAWSAADIQGSGGLVVPPVDVHTLVRGRGRLIGAGGEYANRVYVNSWYIIGPFPGGSRGRQPDPTVYPPEEAVLLDAVYLGKDGRLLQWRYLSSQSYPLIPPDATEDAVYYGYTEVSVNQDCDLTAWIGADDNATVYFNDRLVWRGGTISLMQYLYAIWAPGTTHLRDYNLTEGQRVLHFNKGRNKVFFKLSNGRQGTHLSFVLTR